MAELVDQVLEAVAVGVGPGQAAADLGAKDGADVDVQAFSEGGDVEAGEVKDLLDAGCFHQLFEQGCLGLAAVDANAADVVVVVADLHQAEAIAAVDQAHGFGVHRECAGGPE